MEKLILAMARKVDNDEAEGYLASCCVKQFSGEYQIMTGARTAKKYQSPFGVYARLLGKLFHTITQGYPEPGKLLNEILEIAVNEFKEAVNEDSKTAGEFTVTGQF
jgi:hypothetical protein